MRRISVTFSVLKPLRSRLVKPVQPANMLVMVTVLDVLKPLRSRLVKLLHPSNMPIIFCTELVFK